MVDHIVELVEAKAAAIQAELDAQKAAARKAARSNRETECSFFSKKNTLPCYLSFKGHLPA